MPVAPAELRWHEEVDIGIVGAGGCGLAAADAAAHDHLKVAVWERAKAAGGNTALSQGMVPGAGTRLQRDAGIFDSGEDLARDILQRNGGHSDPTLTRQLCDRSAALVDWLVDEHRIPLRLLASVGDPGHSRRRLHAPLARSGQPLIAGLLRTLERRGIRLRVSTPVLQLWTDDTGAVVGVQIKIPKKSATNVRCAKLIIASDGFAAHAELLKQHCPGASGMPYAGAAGSSGDALTWAADVGALTQQLDSFHAYGPVAVGSNLIIPWELAASGAIWVSQRGEPLGDAAVNPSAGCALLLSQPGHLAYAVFDANVLQHMSARDSHFATEVVPRVARRADELAGLAKQFQIDPEALARTVADSNAAATVATDTVATHALAPPFYGIRITAALLQTHGGLAIDTNARVLRTDATPVFNLYAGGGAAVGLSGPGSDGYLLGTGLLCALGWGKIAGEHAAQEVLAGRVVPAPAPPQPEGDPVP